MNRRYSKIVAVLAASIAVQTATADLVINLDFGANWTANLADLAADSAIDPFSAAEQATLEAQIAARIDAAYGDYNVSVQQNNSAGATDTINFGAMTTDNNGVLGNAGLDFGNLSSQTTNVFSHNFEFIINEFNGSANRATQIDQLSAALAGTASHELGHSLGLLHHHAYSADGITPGNYANTGGLQNQHISATGSTGLNEVGRETDRTFSTLENLVLEAAGGFDAGTFGVSGTALAANPLMQVTSDLGGGDVGNTTGTAAALGLTSLAISQTDAAHVAGALSTDADVDVYSFTATNSGILVADIFSEDRFVDSFDSRIRLFDTDGVTVLADNTDVFYDGNTFNAGTNRSNDSSLINIAIAAAGDYFLEVSSVGNISGGDGGVYSLLFGVRLDSAAVPEPSTNVAIGLILAGFWVRSRSQRKKQTVTV